MISNSEFVSAFAGSLGRPAWFPLPDFVWNFVFGEERAVMITKGQKVVPTRTLEAGYKFRSEPLIFLSKRVLSNGDNFNIISGRYKNKVVVKSLSWNYSGVTKKLDFHYDQRRFQTCVYYTKHFIIHKYIFSTRCHRSLNVFIILQIGNFLNNETHQK